MARIDHPNVVKCYAVDEFAGKHFVAMELMEGQSMQDWLDELGKLTVPDALHVVLICADALSHAHGLNMIHRDIKPDNILVTRQGLVKVADFGLAKALDEDVSMTQSGTGLGTPHYMPPEQAPMPSMSTVGVTSTLWAARSIISQQANFPLGATPSSK